MFGAFLHKVAADFKKSVLDTEMCLEFVSFCVNNKSIYSDEENINSSKRIISEQCRYDRSL